MKINRKVEYMRTYSTSGLVSARQIIDTTGDRILYPDNSSSKATRLFIIKPNKK